MSVTIDGTNGVTTPDVEVSSGGSASAPAITVTGDTNTGIFFPAADTIAFAEGGAEAMRIDSSGNVGIGTSSPTSKLHVNAASGYATVRVGSASLASRNNDNDVYFYCNSTTAETYLIDGAASLIYQDDGRIQFNTAPSGTAGNPITFTERARITSAGDLLLGTTTNLYGPSRLQATDDSATGAFCFQGTSGTAGFEVGQIWKTNTSGDNKFLAWITEGGSGTERGSVSYNRAGNLVSYNTTSDYRLKENIIDLTNALETVARLQPRQFTWKETGNTTTGFIAHELAEVLPHAVTGKKDETELRQVLVSPRIPATYDEDGNELTPSVEAVYEEREVPKYQGVDTSFLVATLTAAIQELKAINDAQASRIETLEAKVAALEANNV